MTEHADAAKVVWLANQAVAEQAQRMPKTHLEGEALLDIDVLALRTAPVIRADRSTSDCPHTPAINGSAATFHSFSEATIAGPRESLSIGLACGSVSVTFRAAGGLGFLKTIQGRPESGVVMAFSWQGTETLMR
jgi:hypothetical protein